MHNHTWDWVSSLIDCLTEIKEIHQTTIIKNYLGIVRSEYFSNRIGWEEKFTVNLSL